MKLGEYELNKIYNEDCYEAIKKIPDKSIDLIVTDPPYEYDKNSFKGFFETRKVGKELNDLDLFCGITNNILNEYIRVLKNINIYIWCNKAQIIQYLDFFVNKHNCSYDILIWAKNNPAPLYANTYLTDKEYCLYFRKGGYCKPTDYENARTIFKTPLNMGDKKLFEHPTIKPIEIIKTLIRNSSKENDIVLDNCMGSGTTGEACMNLGRNFIGIEKDKEYFEIAEKRLLKKGE